MTCLDFCEALPAFLLGILLAFGELLSRYKTGRFIFRSKNAILYLLINWLASIFAYLVASRLNSIIIKNKTNTMMNFFINIEDTLRTICYRLQNDSTWAVCHNPQEILQNDWCTTDRETVMALQQEAVEIMINGERYVINPISPVDIFEHELHYVIYGFHAQNPMPPTLPQLQVAFLNANDMDNNTLILKTDGLFYFVNNIDNSIIDPDIVCQYNGFIAGNGYVGEAINNNDEYVANYFEQGIQHWEAHLITKEMHKMVNME